MSTIAAPPGRPPHDPVDTPATDDALVALLVGGSDDALAALYDRHAGSVYATAMRVCRDSAAAADVVQETFLALWNRAERFDATRGSLLAWLVTIARNRAVDRLRWQTARDAIVFSAYEPSPADDGSAGEWLMSSASPLAMAVPEPPHGAAALDRETRVAIACAIKALPPDERQVIDLAYTGGLTQSEVATALGWPLGTVKTRTRRALRRMRDALQAASEATGARSGIGAHARRTRPCPVAVEIRRG